VQYACGPEPTPSSTGGAQSSSTGEQQASSTGEATNTSSSTGAESSTGQQVSSTGMHRFCVFRRSCLRSRLASSCSHSRLFRFFPSSSRCADLTRFHPLSLGEAASSTGQVISSTAEEFSSTGSQFGFLFMIHFCLCHSFLFHVHVFGGLSMRAFELSLLCGRVQVRSFLRPHLMFHHLQLDRNPFLLSWWRRQA
jgi:hypothetical protein